jgi:4-amino-4-deoxy-L-arabinose transferase-like glycosyltransferase
MGYGTLLKKWPKWFGLTLIAAAVLRLLLMGQIALTDNTESRYGLIGWQMARSGDWVTPRLYVAGRLEPFKAKPPLEFWLTAISYKVFGVSSWAARVPSFLIAVGLVAATVLAARHFWGKRVACLAGAMLVTSGLFFYLAGACVLDVSLTAGVTAAMICFARFAEGGVTVPLGRKGTGTICAQHPPGRFAANGASPPAAGRRAWGIGFFLALGVAMLAKGPLALVLVGLSLAAWLTLMRRWRLAVELPWGWGLAGFLLVAAPWYIAEERAVPGFLRYFIVHEHFLRYVTSDYGDLFGAGRVQPYGTVWLMLLGAMLPWTGLAIAAVARVRLGRGVLGMLRSDPWLAYVLFWGLVPPVFFTLARQLLFTYLLPGIPGLALAAAVAMDFWMNAESGPAYWPWLRAHGVILAVGAVGAAVAAVVWGASPVLAVAAATPAVVWGFLAGGIFRREGPATATAGFGLATLMFAAVLLVAMAPLVNDQQSAEVIVARLHEATTAPRRPIILPCDEAYSAIFYAEAVLGDTIEHHPPAGRAKIVAALLDRPGDGDTLLFKRKDWTQLEPELAARLVPVVETVNWIAVRKRGK